MKLVSLKFLDRYNCIDSINIPFRRLPTDASDELSPICLVGLNGSGKSNVIEALSEIFCLVDLSDKIYSPTRSIATFSFVLDYIIRYESLERRVRIAGNKGKSVSIFLLKMNSDPDLESNWEVVKSEEIKDLMPTRVIGYSSGHNETISFPFLRSEAFYSKAVRMDAKEEQESKSKNLQSENLDKNTNIPSPSSLFVDYDFNALMLIANSMFHPDRLESSYEHLRLSGLRSFRLKICFRLSEKKYVKRTTKLDAIVEKLKSCAILKQGNPDSPTGLILDFYNSEATQTHFREHFESAINLFESLHRLHLLNAIKLQTPERNYYMKDQRKGGLVPRPPSVPDRERVFATSAVQVKLQKNIAEMPVIIDYAGISDGEHQFMLIFGTLSLFDDSKTLFLLDEPESHFNPKWRSEFVKLTTDMLSVRKNTSELPEIVISTHSPFVVSGCKARNVFKFSRDEDAIVVTQPNEETYGASFDYLLAMLFDMEALIATKPAEEMNAILQSSSIEQLERAKEKFGSSIEKAAIFMRLDELVSIEERT
jgi:restriction system-associated AAA family ATPase